MLYQHSFAQLEAIASISIWRSKVSALIFNIFLYNLNEYNLLNLGFGHRAYGPLWFRDLGTKFAIDPLG